MTPAEKRDATLRTVQLPDCCGNCQHWRMDENDRGYERCHVLCDGKGGDYWRVTDSEYEQLCDLHARKPDGGNG